MTANRYTVQLHRNGRHIRRHDQATNLDVNSDAILRDWLERLVKAEAGTLHLDLSNGWELRVRDVEAPRVRAKVTVDRSGRTVVKR